MNKQKTTIKDYVEKSLKISRLVKDLEKYKHELATLKSLKSHIRDVFNARIEIVEEKIAECLMFMKEDRKERNNGNEEKRP